MMSSGNQQVPGRDAALARLDEFLPMAGRLYGSRRNFDLGPNDRENVSMLSAPIRHRLITEDEVLRATLAVHTLADADKYVQEVFWRAYFKGWLEHRPAVWSNYVVDVADLVEGLEKNAELKSRYEQAIHGNTGIDCFDAWVTELLQTGYLHNHARMWFASIWVFTLELPWQLGADLFLRHLMDADPASNTLSWRWVSGLHTKGKTYLARVSNIMSYTNGRFNPERKLAIHAPPLTEKHDVPIRPLPQGDAADDVGRFGLLVTEEDCLPESLGLPGRPAAAIGLSATAARSPLEVGMPARAFTLGAVADALERTATAFDCATEQQDASDWAEHLAAWAKRNNVTTIVTSYTPVGPVASILSDARRELAQAGIEIRLLRRAYDEAAWPHASKGFFKLKARIPDILAELGIDPMSGQQPDLFANAS